MRMELDHKLIRKVQILTTGANVHKVNGIINTYQLYIHLYNNYMDKGRKIEAEEFLQVIDEQRKKMEEIAAKANTKRIIAA